MQTWLAWAHLDVAAEQTAFIKHEGPDANSLLVSRTVHALLIKRCDLWFPWFLDALDSNRGECSRMSTMEKVEIAWQRLREVFSTHVPDGKDVQ